MSGFIVPVLIVAGVLVALWFYYVELTDPGNASRYDHEELWPSAQQLKSEVDVVSSIDKELELLHHRVAEETQAIQDATAVADGALTVAALIGMHARSHTNGQICRNTHIEARRARDRLQHMLGRLDRISAGEKNQTIKSSMSRYIYLGKQELGRLNSEMAAANELRKQHDLATRNLKYHIRDNCGAAGREWYHRKKYK